MEPRRPGIIARHDLTAAETEGIEDRLYQFNVQRTGYDDGELLAFVAELEGEMVGAVAGYTWGGICELRQVWIHDDHRGQGLGVELMGEAVREARARGCADIFLTTYDFQAPGFYARLGFRAVAEIRDKPVGHTEFVMRLSLAGGGLPPGILD
jgi:N-acetylglutamate synthase-like GNAT family acetyltransferase